MHQFAKGIAVTAIAWSLGAVEFTLAADPTAAQISFINTAAQAGMMEFEAAKTALSASQNTAVKEYAYRMLYDYDAINARLAAAAKKSGIPVPSELDEEHAKALQSLRDTPLQAFDTTYFAQVILEQGKTVELLQSNLLNSDTELAVFSSYNLPRIREHKRLATELKAGLTR